jgi:uncharacterized protein YjbI with pentapeptide repeats
MPDTQQSPKPANNSKDTNIRILIAFLLGIAVMALFAYTGMDYLLGNLRIILGVIVLLSVFIILALFLINRYKEVLFQKLLGVDTTELQDLESNATGLIKDISTNNLDEATQKATHIGKKVFAWYSWKMYRQYVLQVVQAIFVVFGGVIGSYLLFVQNEKIEAQNERLTQQTYLQEANRRSSLVFLFSNIMDAIDRELTTDVEEKGKRDLSPQLIGRIISLSNVLKPYYYLDGNNLTKKPLSPERAQLFTNLVNSDLDRKTLYNIIQNANFNYSDFRGVDFKRTLNHLSFSGKFSYSDFTNADLYDCEFTSSDMKYCIFNNTNISGVNFSASYLENADFSNCRFEWVYSAATFPLAKISGIKLNNVDINMFDFDNAMFLKKEWLDDRSKIDIKTHNYLVENYYINFQRADFGFQQDAYFFTSKTKEDEDNN